MSKLNMIIKFNIYVSMSRQWLTYLRDVHGLFGGKTVDTVTIVWGEMLRVNTL